MLKKIAQNIAKSTSEVIGCGVLVTDENGVIIGCSDDERLGDTHWPSLEVIRKARPIVTSPRDAAGLSKVKPGYTLPIKLFDKVIGTVSIAGLPEEVGRYGLLVQKQAEIMMREQAYLESNVIRERALRDLLESVARFDRLSDNQDMILLQAKELGYNLSKCRTALFVEMKSWQSGSAESAFQMMLGELHAVFSNPRNIICPFDSCRTTILFSPSASGADASVCEAAAELANDLASGMNQKGVDVNIAIGRPADSLDGLAESMRSARNAMRICNMLGASGVVMAESYRLEALISQLSDDRRAVFAKQTLGPLLGRSDYNDIRDTFFAWCQSPFASGEAARKLSMHRNSLQYRLKKIRQLTGRDPWNFKEAFELWTAFTIIELTDKEAFD